MTIAELNAKLVNLNEQATQLFNIEDRTAEQNAAFDSLLNEIDSVKAEKARVERMENLAAPAPRKTGSPVVQAKTNFANSNDFFKAVAQAAGGQVDPRLVNAAGDYAQEGTPADGGYLVPVDARTNILSLISGPERLFGRLDILPINGNQTTIPLDEDAVWAQTAGIHPYNVNEAVAGTSSTPVFKQLSITLAKKMVLVYVTEEMLTDAANIGSFVTNKSSDKLGYAIDADIFTAMTGSGSLKTVAKTGGAAVGSAPDLANVQAMWVALHTSFRKNAVWLANPALETVFMGYTVGNMPVYIPAGGISQAPYGTLFGKPVIFTENAAAVGTAGDLVLVDPSSFYGVIKSGGQQNSVSAHFKFDQDITAFKATVRFAAKSKLSAVITRPDSTTASNVVVLATR